MACLSYESDSQLLWNTIFFYFCSKYQQHLHYHSTLRHRKTAGLGTSSSTEAHLGSPSRGERIQTFKGLQVIKCSPYMVLKQHYTYITHSFCIKGTFLIYFSYVSPYSLPLLLMPSLRHL